MRHYAKLLRATLSASLMLVAMAGAAVGGPFEDAVDAYVRGDYATAYRLFQPLAEQGNAEAQYDLGSMYANGQGVQQDYAEAVKWYSKAADQGLAHAQHNLGVMYRAGQGVPQDYAEALKWFREAAEQGHAIAQYSLGVMYHQGEGLPQNYAKALKWFRLAADQGHNGENSSSVATLRRRCCDRCVAAGLPLGRTQVFIDTLRSSVRFLQPSPYTPLRSLASFPKQHGRTNLIAYRPGLRASEVVGLEVG